MGSVVNVIELVDLRYRPEVNTIGALAESDSSEHVPFAEPIWTTTPEESGLRFVAQQKFEFVSFVGVARQSQTCGRSDNNMQHNMAKRIASTAYQGMRAKQGRCKRLYVDPHCRKWCSCDRS